MKKASSVAKTLQGYAALLTQVKSRIRSAQVRATLGANAEMLAMYWDVGRTIEQRQKAEGWGAAVIPRLARDIRNEPPEVKGFSERNIGYMIRFAREYAGIPIAGLGETYDEEWCHRKADHSEDLAICHPTDQ